MEQIQTALLRESDSLRARAVRLLASLARGGLGALLRDVRAFEMRVRLWLIALALEARPKSEPGRVAHQIKREARPAWYLEQKRAERTPPAPRGKSMPLGLSLGIRSSEQRAPKDPQTSSTRQPRQKCASMREVRLAALIFKILNIRRTISDPDAALARLRKAHMGRAAPEIPAADFNLYTDDPYADHTSEKCFFRAAPRPRSDDSS